MFYNSAYATCVSATASDVEMRIGLKPGEDAISSIFFRTNGGSGGRETVLGPTRILFLHVLNCGHQKDITSASLLHQQVVMSGRFPLARQKSGVSEVLFFFLILPCRLWGVAFGSLHLLLCRWQKKSHGLHPVSVVNVLLFGAVGCRHSPGFAGIASGCFLT